MFIFLLSDSFFLKFFRIPLTASLGWRWGERDTLILMFVQQATNSFGDKLDM